MPKIENVSKIDVASGNHFECGSDAILIQIGDPASEFPKPKIQFSEIYQFEFLDADDSDIDEYGEEPLFSDDQARMIIMILDRCLYENRDVIVQCISGESRSGAVVEAANVIGFDTTNRYRNQNLRVKNKLMQVWLGFN